MPEPNISKRKLKGVGGKHFFDIPGVIYPKDLIVVKPGYHTVLGTPYPEAPSWGITTSEAAEILGSSYSSARVLLRRKRVKFRLVKKINSPPATYWDRNRVKELAKDRPPLIELDDPPQLIGPKDAAELLQIGRSTIQRAISNGFLHPIIVRIKSEQGPRKRSLLRLAEIKKLASALQAKHLRQIEKAQAFELSNLFPPEGQTNRDTRKTPLPPVAEDILQKNQGK